MSKKKNRESYKNKNLKSNKKFAENQEKKLENSNVNENISSEMPSSKKQSKLYYAILVLILLAVLTYFGIQKYGNLFVVATVNGNPITRVSLWQKLEKQAGKQVLDQMISEKLIEQEAQAKGIKVDSRDIDKKIQELEKQFKGKAGLDQVLNLQGMTREDLVTQLRYNLLVEKMVPSVKVTDKEIADYYEQNQSTYRDELTDAVKKEIRNTQKKKKRSKVISEWFDNVKKKAKINNYL